MMIGLIILFVIGLAARLLFGFVCKLIGLGLDLALMILLLGIVIKVLH